MKIVAKCLISFGACSASRERLQNWECDCLCVGAGRGGGVGGLGWSQTPGPELLLHFRWGKLQGHVRLGRAGQVNGERGEEYGEGGLTSWKQRLRCSTVTLIMSCTLCQHLISQCWPSLLHINTFASLLQLCDVSTYLKSAESTLQLLSEGKRTLDILLTISRGAVCEIAFVRAVWQGHSMEFLLPALVTTLDNVRRNEHIWEYSRRFSRGFTVSW